jgi:hypothetical protein
LNHFWIIRLEGPLRRTPTSPWTGLAYVPLCWPRSFELLYLVNLFVNTLNVKHFVYVFSLFGTFLNKIRFQIQFYFSLTSSKALLKCLSKKNGLSEGSHSEHEIQDLQLLYLYNGQCEHLHWHKIYIYSWTSLYAIDRNQKIRLAHNEFAYKKTMDAYKLRDSFLKKDTFKSSYAILHIKDHI